MSSRQIWNYCLSVDEFASELTNCLSVDEFASELTKSSSVDEIREEMKRKWLKCLGDDLYDALVPIIAEIVSNR